MTRLANVVTGAFALGILSIASSPAISQSVPFSWTGAYIGGNAGATFHPGSSAFSGGGLYVDLGEAGLGTQSVKFNTSMARFGVNYRFAASQ